MANKERLIGANALWDYVKTTPIDASTRVTIMCLLNTAPTVDAVEVVHGRWVMDDYTHRYRCSVCKAYQPYDTVGDYIDYWDCDYCPNCGVKMDGGNEDVRM